MQSKSRTRDQRRRDWNLRNPNRKAEDVTSTGGVDAHQLNITSTGWRGKNFTGTKEGRALIRAWKNGTIGKQLLLFKQIPYREQ